MAITVVIDVANSVVCRAAHQAVGRAHHTFNTCRAAAPCNRPGVGGSCSCIVPARTPDHITAVTQNGNPAAIGKIVGADQVVGCTAHKAVCVAHHTLNTRGTAAKRHCSSVGGCAIVPCWIGDEKVAITQFGDSTGVDDIIRRCSHKAVRYADGSLDARGAATPCECPDIWCRPIVPGGASYEITAITEFRNSTTADCVTRCASDEAGSRADDARHACCAAAKCDCTHIERSAIIPVWIDHQEIPVRQLGNRAVVCQVPPIGGPHEAGGGIHHACHACRAAGPCQRADICGGRAIP